jgi:raffinose/stachyose/melibiose transport system substrate-binding protein
MRTRFLVVLFILLSIVSTSLFAGGQKDSGAAEKGTIGLWITVFTPATMREKPQNEWYVAQASKRFEAANPNLKVDFNYIEQQETINQRLKAAAIAKTGPDVINVWTGQQIFQIKDIVLPLDKYVPKADLDQIASWDIVRDGFKKDGPILGAPVGGSEAVLLFYNKALVKKAGLDFEASPPATTAEFDTALQKLKASGTMPILTDESTVQNGLPWLMLTAGYYWYAQVSTHAKVASNSMGQTKYSEDAGFLNAMKYYQSLYARGFVNVDAASSADSDARFLKGAGAIRPNGNWMIADYEAGLGADLGVILPPDIDPKATFTRTCLGGPGQAMVVAGYSKVPVSSMKLISFFNSKKEMLEQLKIEPKIPMRKDITPEEIGWGSDPVLSKVAKWGPNIRYWVDNSTQPEVNLEFMNTSNSLLTGKETPEAFAKRLDQKAAEVNR